MGKLYKIRREFNRLNHNDKLKMYERKCGYNFKNEFTDSQGMTWHFDCWSNSYRKFVAKLAQQYYSHEIVQKRHVIERAYLNNEPWAIAQVEKSFIWG